MKKQGLNAFLCLCLGFFPSVLWAQIAEHPLMTSEEVSLRAKIDLKELPRLSMEDSLKVQNQLSQKPGAPAGVPQPGEEIPTEAH